jgi:hypothetical protein
MFVYDTLCLKCVVAWLVCGLCIHVCLLYVIIFLTIESNDECAEEGEIFEYQEEEDQGQANQGKPSILDTYLILFTYFACFIKVY